MEKIGYIHTRAQQKYTTATEQLADYFIGDKYYRNRERVEQNVQSIINKLGSDKLPGVNDTHKNDLTEALSNYKKTKDDQKGAQSDATGSRKNLGQLIKDIKPGRLQIQLAIQATYPHTNPANAGVRQEFGLPPDKALRVR